MAKILMLAAFLVGISYALAQSGATTSLLMPLQTVTATPTPSPTSPPPSSPAPSPSMPPHTSTPMPSPTPTPTPAMEDFRLYYNNSTNVCLHMDAGLGVTVHYETHSGIINKTFELSGNATIGGTSMCNATNATLVLLWIPNDNFFLTFRFSKADANHWQEGEVTFDYTLTEELFPGYSGGYNRSEVQFGSGKLFEDTPIEFERSYLCNKTRIFTGYGIDTRNTTNVTLSVDDFHVQAFNFTNSSTGAFDNARNCEAGTTSKIVPIAVGAALAGLVIVVLIAYLIGRFRNRKQSSYEALS